MNNRLFVLAFCALLIILPILACGSTSTPSAKTAPTQIAASADTSAPPPAAPTPSGPRFDDVCTKPEGMTDLQLKDHLKSFQGLKVEWTGYVFNATERAVEISKDAKEDTILWSRQIELRGVPIETAGKLQVNQKIKFTGTIKEVGTFLGSICNPLVIEDVTITP